MLGKLVKKATRTVYGEKVCRVVVDVPYDQIENAEGDDQDMLKWLDSNVDNSVRVEIGPFGDEDQEGLVDLADRAKEVNEMDSDELHRLEDVGGR